MFWDAPIYFLDFIFAIDSFWGAVSISLNATWRQEHKRKPLLLSDRQPMIISLGSIPQCEMSKKKKAQFIEFSCHKYLLRWN